MEEKIATGLKVGAARIWFKVSIFTLALLFGDSPSGADKISLMLFHFCFRSFRGICSLGLREQSGGEKGPVQDVFSSGAALVLIQYPPARAKKGCLFCHTHTGATEEGLRASRWGEISSSRIAQSMKSAGCQPASQKACLLRGPTLKQQKRANC